MEEAWGAIRTSNDAVNDIESEILGYVQGRDAL